MMRSILAVVALGALALTATLGPADAKDTKDSKARWGDGVPFTTDYEAAIKQARESGKMLLVYNGWERPDI